MNNDMMLVPRELLERLDCGKNMRGALDSLPELRALLADPSAIAAPLQRIKVKFFLPTSRHTDAMKDAVARLSEDMTNEK